MVAIVPHLQMHKHKNDKLFLIQHDHTNIQYHCWEILNIKTHLSHAFFMSLYKILAVFCTILYNTCISCLLSLWAGTACLALWLLVLSRCVNVTFGDASYRHAGVCRRQLRTVGPHKLLLNTDFRIATLF